MISASVENSPENIEKELNPDDDSILNKPKEDELFIMVPTENDLMNNLTEKSKQEIMIPQTGKVYTIEKC